MDYSAMDRFRDALAGKPGDRVPLFPMIAGWAAANFAEVPAPALSRSPDLIAQAQIAAKETLGYDSLYAYADALYIPEAFGCKVRFLETGPLVSPLMPSIGDARELPEPDVKTSGRLPVILELAEKLGSYSKDRIPVLGMFEGPFTTLCRVVEAEHILRLVYKNPSLLNELLDRIAAFLLQFGRALLESGANVIFIPEPTASASMISPAMFRRFVLPRLQRLTQELPAPCILHICGNTAPLLEPMAHSGADVLSLDQCMDLSAARAASPGVSLGGNVDPVDALLMGTKEKVAEAARKCLQKAGTARFVLMSGCGIPPASPIENVRAMVCAAEEYGLGPDGRESPPDVELKGSFDEQ